MKVYAWLIDFAHFRENCPTGIIPEWMQKVTEHDGIIQYKKLHDGASRRSITPQFHISITGQPNDCDALLFSNIVINNHP